MRLDFTSSNLRMLRLNYDDLGTMRPSRGQARISARTATRSSAAEVAKAGLDAESRKAAATSFATAVAAAGSSISGRNRIAGPAAGREGTIGASTGRTADALSVPPSTDKVTAGLEKAAPKVFHTPFGTYDEMSINERLVVDVVGRSSEEIYFMTHAPGEWKNNPAARLEFAKLYGQEALVTVDRHGTVPKNTDPVWITKPFIDTATGGA